MTDRHIKRGFLDDSRLDNVAVRSFEKSTEIGKMVYSQKERETETAAEELIENGKPKTATDTQGEWKDAGLVQCKRCGEPCAEDEYRTYKKNGVVYRCTYCRTCENEMEKTRRFSRVTPVSPYPWRLS